VDWTHLAEDREKWRGCFEHVMNILVPEKLRFSSKTLLD
jgi:hypothetical protein